MHTNYLSPKSDIIFKRIFGDEKNVDILKSFLNAVLKLPHDELHEIIIIDPNLRQDNADDKLSVLDLKLKTSIGTTINVEIQLLSLPEMKERVIFYVSKMVTEQLSAGENYDHIKRVVTIIITDFRLVGDSAAYHNVYRLYDKDNNSIFTDLIEVNTLELPKLPRQEDNSEIWSWAQFFKTKSKEEFDMLALKNEGIQKAVAKLAELSQDEKTRLQYEYEEKKRRDFVSRIEGAKKEGVEIGIAQGMELGIEKGVELGIEKGVELGIEKGMELGIEKGVELGRGQGVEQGVEIGRKNALLDTALMMKKSGIEAERISHFTGLAVSEIDKL